MGNVVMLCLCWYWQNIYGVHGREVIGDFAVRLHMTVESNGCCNLESIPRKVEDHIKDCVMRRHGVIAKNG